MRFSAPILVIMEVICLLNPHRVLAVTQGCQQISTGTVPVLLVARRRVDGKHVKAAPRLDVKKNHGCLIPWICGNGIFPLTEWQMLHQNPNRGEKQVFCSSGV